MRRVHSYPRRLTATCSLRPPAPADQGGLLLRRKRAAPHHRAGEVVDRLAPIGAGRREAGGTGRRRSDDAPLSVLAAADESIRDLPAGMPHLDLPAPARRLAAERERRP